MSEISDQFYEEVMLRLGGSIVDVEMTECDFSTAFRAAKRTFKQKGHDNYRRAFLALEVNKATTTYQLPTEVDTVVKIIKPTYGWTVEDPFAMATYNEVFASAYRGGAGSRADFLSYELSLQLVEMWQRYTVYDAQFDFDVFKKELRLLRKPETTTTWIVECYTTLTDDEYMQIDWIIRMTIALSKQILGAAYRKLGQVSGPDGPVQLPGSEMIQEGKEEERILIEEIDMYTDGAADFNEIRLG
jgi:hypothetical protein